MRRTLFAVVLSCFAAAKAGAISPPQYQLQRTLKHSVGASPLVTVGDVAGDSGPLSIDVQASSLDMARGLAFILNREYDFGGIRVSVRVLDPAGGPVVVPDTPATGDPVAESKTLTAAALAENPLFVGFGSVPFADYSVATEPVIIAFWNDNLADPHGNTQMIARDAFETVCRPTHFGSSVRLGWSTARAHAGFASSGFVPAVAHVTGSHGSHWTTDLAIVSAGASSVRLWFHRADLAGAAPLATVTLNEPVTTVADVVATLFETTGTGAIRYEADGPVRIVGRTSTPSASGGVSAHMVRSMSAREAARGGEDGRGLVMVVDQRPGFRANLGLLNPSASPVTVTVLVLGPDGSPAPGQAHFDRVLPSLGVTQINDVLGRLSPGERAGLLVIARITSPGGALLAYLSDIDNATNDPTFQEAAVEPFQDGRASGTADRTLADLGTAPGCREETALRCRTQADAL